MRTVIAVLALLMLAGPKANAQKWQGSREDSVFVAQTLAEAGREKSIGSVSLYFARKFLDRPYVEHTLEVGNDHTVVVNTRQLDCTTLVENVVALTLCYEERKLTFANFVAKLEQMRYRNGVMNGYVSRLHYYTDWIENNTRKGLVSEVQGGNPPFSAVQTVKVNYMSTHPDSYKELREHPEYVSAISEAERAITGKTFRYIPKSGVKDTEAMRQAVHDGDIIAITCNKPGLDISHLGFAVWSTDGLHLLNASMIHGKVIDEPMTFRKYLTRHKSDTGIRIVRIKPAE